MKVFEEKFPADNPTNVAVTERSVLSNRFRAAQREGWKAASKHWLERFRYYYPHGWDSLNIVIEIQKELTEDQNVTAE